MPIIYSEASRFPKNTIEMGEALLLICGQHDIAK